MREEEGYGRNIKNGWIAHTESGFDQLSRAVGIVIDVQRGVRSADILVRLLFLLLNLGFGALGVDQIVQSRSAFHGFGSEVVPHRRETRYRQATPCRCEGRGG